MDRSKSEPAFAACICGGWWSDCEDGVHHKATHDDIGTIPVALQQLIQQADRCGEVTKKVVNAGAHRIRCDPLIALGHWLNQQHIDICIENEYRAGERLDWVIHIGGCIGIGSHCAVSGAWLTSHGRSGQGQNQQSAQKKGESFHKEPIGEWCKSEIDRPESSIKSCHAKSIDRSVAAISIVSFVS